MPYDRNLRGETLLALHEMGVRPDLPATTRQLVTELDVLRAMADNGDSDAESICDEVNALCNNRLK